jgi:hypothetical protein
VEQVGFVSSVAARTTQTMRMLGDRRVLESDEDAKELVEELKKLATIFQNDSLSREDQIRVCKAELGLVVGVSESHLVPPVPL